MKKITACICTYNRYDLLPLAIESLSNQICEFDYEILVVDNSPQNENIEINKRKYLNDNKIIYRWIETPGLSNARNYAVNNSNAEYIAYMDDDAIASNEWLKSIVFAYENLGDKVVCVGGVVEPIWEIERPSWLHSWLEGYVSIVNWGNGKTPRIAKNNEWMAGTNISFKLDFLKNYALFDTKLGRNGDGSVLLSNEEVKIAETIKKNGFEIGYYDKVHVRHLVAKERLTHEWFRRRIVWQVLSDFIANPKSVENNIKSLEDYGLDYFYKIEPRSRNIYGIFKNTSESELFLRQLKAIEAVVANILTSNRWSVDEE